jgi:hypothetical protein
MTNKIRGSIIDLPQAAASYPISGTYTAGQIIYNNQETGPTGWRCTLSGTPGTWKAFGDSILNATQTWDPPSLTSMTKTDITVSVPGAVLGDFAVASHSLDITGCMLTAIVSAASTVTVSLLNISGGSINVGLGTLAVRVYKK